MIYSNMTKTWGVYYDNRLFKRFLTIGKAKRWAYDTVKEKEWDFTKVEVKEFESQEIHNK